MGVGAELVQKQASPVRYGTPDTRPALLEGEDL